jgi:predicted DCC family thiol-disulfide oxidoreductase YuxK
MKLTLFYDGMCPLCQKEMQHLIKYNTAGHLAFVDIMEPGFSEAYPHLDWDALNNRIHGQTDSGSVITGLDVTYLAWKLVGKGWVYAPTRWPVIRWFADKCYNVFAKHRYTISYWLTGQRRCERCVLKN